MTARTSTDETPDFEELRAKRNAAVSEMIRQAAIKMGGDPAEARSNFNPNDCYCACPEGPCEHDFQGWRDIENERGEVCGGEQVCKRCGMGAMSHSLRTDG